jgi:Coenzyme PQQ synthesis protein D (PqqD)
VMLWHLNPVARAIWAMLDEPAPATLLVEVLAELFPDEAPERLASDLQGLMARLCAEGLIHPAG